MFQIVSILHLPLLNYLPIKLGDGAYSVVNKVAPGSRYLGLIVKFSTGNSSRRTHSFIH